MPVAPINGKQEAIDNLKEDVREIFSRIHKIEVEGCAHGKHVAMQVTELKEEIKKSKNLLWIILLVLAATQGPQVGDLLATVKAQQAAIEALQLEVQSLKARVSKLEGGRGQ